MALKLGLNKNGEGAGLKVYLHQGGLYPAAPLRNASPTAKDSTTIALGWRLFKLRFYFEYLCNEFFLISHSVD
jgi:hypothetical protein